MNLISNKLSRLSLLSQEMSKVKPESLSEAKHFVFSDGDCMSKLLLIGEAPGEYEDLCKTPFVGASGELLDKILSAINLSRRDVYVTNVVPWRPNNNRTPTIDEVKTFVPFLITHIEIIDPKVIVLLGATAAKGILSSDETVTSLRSRLHEYKANNKTYSLSVTYHPSFLLRSPGHKKDSWEDWKKIRDILNN